MYQSTAVSDAIFILLLFVNFRLDMDILLPGNKMPKVTLVIIVIIFQHFCRGSPFDKKGTTA